MPKQPPRDKNGNVIPHDDLQILPQSNIVRRISLQQTAEVNGVRRISSVAFKGSSDPTSGISVDIEQFMLEDGVDPKKFVTTPKWIGSISLTADEIRNENLQVGFDPTEETEFFPANPYHGEIWGKPNRAQIQRLLNLARWYVEIDGVSII